jgi:gamma-glutamyl:cysteine ligase YbdK (ATP-grasp superfamily)
MFRFGIEHETAFLKNVEFADFSNMQFEDFAKIINELPVYSSDKDQLRIGDAKIKVKRWYSEGYERFDEDGKLIASIPKAIEIRTPICPSIDSTVTELLQGFSLLNEVARKYNFHPVWISFNPFQEKYEPNPPLNQFEKDRAASTGEQLSTIPMLTFGPDLNISNNDFTDEENIDIAKKLTYYSPFIVPFSFSSPFYKGQLWDGQSVRTFFRSTQRPSVHVYVKDENLLIKSLPFLTKRARIPAEIGRIEFKAFDTCEDFHLYGALLALLKGLCLDKDLPGRSITPDINLHQLAAREAFNNSEIYSTAKQVLDAATHALSEDADARHLNLLSEMLMDKRTPADKIIASYKASQSVIKTLQNSYGQYSI